MKKVTQPSNFVFSHSKDTLFREVSEGAVRIMHFENSDTYFELDHVAAQFWKAIDGRTSVSEIKEHLQKKLETPPGAIDHEVENLIQDLKNHKLIDLI